jgi:hypothetical protein
MLWQQPKKYFVSGCDICTETHDESPAEIFVSTFLCILEVIHFVSELGLKAVSDSLKERGKCRSENICMTCVICVIFAEVSLLLLCVKDGRFCYLFMYLSEVK